MIKWLCAVLWTFSVFMLANTPLDAADPDYLMMHLGSKWTYNAEITKSNGTIDKGTVTVENKEAVEHYDIKYLRQLFRWITADPKKSSQLIRTDATGYFSTPDLEGDYAERTEMILPLKIGSEWEVVLPRRNFANASVVGKEKITVNGVSYADCFHIKVKGGETSYEVWQAAGVGTVKAIFQTLIEEETSVLTLREFKPGKVEGK
jgi:hypothetical protein